MTPTPGHWCWHDGSSPSATEASAAVVFDLDGVLSDAAGRQHYLDAPKRNWDAFFAACGDDPLIEEVGALLGLLTQSVSVVLLTARPLRVQDATLAWLERYGVRWDLLIMRPDRDFRSALDFKRRTLGELRDVGLELQLGFEDDRRNVEMFRSEGVPCVYIHSGYYDG